LQRVASLALQKAYNQVQQAKLEVSKWKAQLLKISSDAELAEKTLTISTMLRDKLVVLQGAALKQALRAKEGNDQA
jgi:hypothetical protein